MSAEIGCYYEGPAVQMWPRIALFHVAAERDKETLRDLLRYVALLFEILVLLGIRLVDGDVLYFFVQRCRGIYCVNVAVLCFI